MNANDLHSGDRIVVIADDIGHMIVTFVGIDTDVRGNDMLWFDAPDHIGRLTLYPSAFNKGIDVGTYSRA